MASVGAERISLETTNGGVTLTLPEKAKATVSASCTNGGINVGSLDNFDVTEKSRRRLEGKLNGGGTEVELRTTNGGIRLRSQRHGQHAHRYGRGRQDRERPQGTQGPQGQDDGSLRAQRCGERGQGHPVSPPEAAGERRLAALGRAAAGRPGRDRLERRAAGRGRSARRPRCARRRGSAAATVLVFVVAAVAASTKSSALPLGFYSGFCLERRYELSKETLGGWLGDQAKSFGDRRAARRSAPRNWSTACIRLSPERWWLTGRPHLRAAHRRPHQSRAGAAAADLLLASSRSIATRCARGCSRWPSAPARACSAPTSGGSARRRRRPTRRSPASAARGGSSSPTRCSPSFRTTRSKSCSRTRSRITCTATSGRGSRSRAC